VDHTWVQEAIEKGILTPELAREHPNVHVIRRYLGSPEPPDPDFRLKFFDNEGDRQAEENQGVQILPDDVVLLCSDGLTDLVWNDEILETVRTKPSLKEASRALVELANSRGGHDNITVVLVAVPADFKLVVKKNRKTRLAPMGRRRDRRYCLCPAGRLGPGLQHPGDRCPDAHTHTHINSYRHSYLTAHADLYPHHHAQPYPGPADRPHLHALADKYQDTVV
jgi:hypothetical protein